MIKKILLLCASLMMLNLSTALCTVAASPDNAKVNLVWQPIVDSNNDLSQIDKLPGVNVVSPSWLAIKSADGKIEDKSDYLYAVYAQKKGYKVWPLITNDFDAEMTHKWLHDENARRYIIRQLVWLARTYPIDGYNFDFENIYDSDRDALSTFIEEAARELKRQHLTLSMDVTVKSNTANWSSCYDRARLGRALDYIVLMAYDEHGRLSKTAGSVASLPWVENGVKSLAAEVPHEKIILGVPLYMRLWQEDGKGSVSASTLSMSAAQNLIRQKKLKPVWLAQKGQRYFTYSENGRTYKVWQENAESLKLKAALVNKYDLAGTAAWRKGFETQDVWQVIDRQISK